MSLVLGIDEAGRGPVIGPMLVAGVLIESSRMPDLKALGVKDSKQLTREERQIFYEKIGQLAVDVHFIHFQPGDLEENLTLIELRAMSEIINKLKPQSVILDAPVPPGGILNFVTALRRRLERDQVEIIAENRADANYEVVSAASIIAKVLRDRAVEQLWGKHGDFGWGYPSEPRTRQFLKDYYLQNRKFPDCARHRWATVQKIAYECDAGALPIEY